jgi:hypothetical protein
LFPGKFLGYYAISKLVTRREKRVSKRAQKNKWLLNIITKEKGNSNMVMEEERGLKYGCGIDLL